MSVSYCASCRKVDDSPKHVVNVFNTPDAYPIDRDMIAAVMADEAISSTDRSAVVDDLYDTTTDRKHIACCAADGCPTDTCKEN